MQKTHKDIYMLVKLHRPILLLNSLEKTLESILAKIINAIAEIYHFLLKTHFKKRRNTSIEHAIHYLVEKTYAEWEKGKKVSALMLDVTGAFDNVSDSRPIHNLRKRRLDPQMIAWIASFVRDQTTIVKTNKCSTNLVHISTGIPKAFLPHSSYILSTMQIYSKYAHHPITKLLQKVY